MGRATTIEVEYRDLIGLPYKKGGTDTSGIDCLGVTRILMARAGRAAPLEAFPVSLDALLSDCEHIAKRVDVCNAVDHAAPWARYWRRVNLPEAKVGDLAFCFDQETATAHVCPLLNRPRHGRPSYVLSATARHGTTVLPVSKLAHLVGFYSLTP